MLKKFTTDLKQEFELSLQESTREKFEMAVKDFDTGRLHIQVATTVNADSIRAKDRQLTDIDLQLKEATKLKPTRCNCDCGADLLREQK